LEVWEEYNLEHLIFNLWTHLLLYSNIWDNGSVSIGNVFPAPVDKLTVDGKILCEKVKVVADITVPDYVFDKDYPLLPIDKLKPYIDKNKHLPDVPSAEEMKKNGLDLGEIAIILLKKIEENTLYIIEQNENIEEQAKQIEELKKENKKLKSIIDKILNNK